MLSAEQCQTILALSRAGESNRSIARRLSIDRKTVNGVLENKRKSEESMRSACAKIDEELLRTLHVDCDGRIQRIHEKLSEEHGVEIAYSTLTLHCRKLGLSAKRKATKRHYHISMDPGEEMQHDTSPYTITLGSVRIKVIASVVYLRYSKMRYLKFYLHFCRYDMKCFLHEALTYFGGCARECIIDNTNLARLSGRGYTAIIHPEMESFSRRYGFEFICHEIKHSNRKAGNERAFWTTETNFLPGRKFANLTDLNAQALEWATVRSPKRPDSRTKLIPAELFETERGHLVPFTPDLPGPTRSYSRVINPYGRIEIATNSYWIPGEGRGTVRVIEHPGSLEVLQSGKTVIRYDKPAQDVYRKDFVPDGTDTRPIRRKRIRPTAMEENELRGYGTEVGAYVDFLLNKARGIRAHNLIRLIHGLSRRIDRDLFSNTIARANRYKIVDYAVIENIAAMLLGQKGWRLPHQVIDPDLQNREAYIQGEISVAPDLTDYDLEYNDVGDDVLEYNDVGDDVPETADFSNENLECSERDNPDHEEDE